MRHLIKTFAAATALIVLASGALAQSTVVPIDNEPAPTLIVMAPLPGPLAKGVVYIPYRVENLLIVALGGETASKMSPRIGHLHVTIDNLPWFWADYGASNTIILGGLPPGPHKIRIEVVDPEGKVFTGQTVTFNVPGKEARP